MSVRAEQQADQGKRRPAQSMLRHATYGLGLIALISGAVNALILVSPIYMLQIFDRVLLTFRVETLLYLSLMAAAAILALALFDGLRGIAAARLGRWWDETARGDILEVALAAARRTGTSPASALQDLQQVRAFLSGPALMPFFDAPWMPLFIFAIFLLHPLLGLVAVFAALVLLCFALANDLLSRLALGEIHREQVQSGRFAGMALRHADVVHAMGMQGAILSRYERQQQSINDRVQKGAERMALIGGTSKAVRIGVQIAILGFGAWLVTRHELTAGGMIAASIVLGRALAPVEQAIGGWRSFTAAKDAHGRIRALLRSVPPAPLPTALPAPAGGLAVENATLLLHGQDGPSLRGVSFAVEPGTMMAVIGPSAAGKSSLCRVLVGSWPPTAGHVRLDGADLAQWCDEDRARYVGYLPQAVELFGGTVRENIARFGDAEDAAVVEAATKAGCHEMILRLPKGYDTDVGEAGAFLSGGQRQRIGLARALLGEPRLVVLDEPNANLDQEGEGALLAAIVELKQRGVTVVLVSHRVATMRAVDMIGVLKGGALEAFGPRDAILKSLRPVPQQLAASASPAAKLGATAQ